MDSPLAEEEEAPEGQEDGAVDGRAVEGLLGEEDGVAVDLVMAKHQMGRNEKTSIHCQLATLLTK